MSDDDGERVRVRVFEVVVRSIVPNKPVEEWPIERTDTLVRPDDGAPPPRESTLLAVVELPAGSDVSSESQVLVRPPTDGLPYPRQYWGMRSEGPKLIIPATALIDCAHDPEYNRLGITLDEDHRKVESS